MEQVSPRTGRLFRAMNNHFEGLILFTLAVVVITLSGQSSTFTQTCAWIYLAARIAYVPAYYFGLSPWRSAIWAVGFTATVTLARFIVAEHEDSDIGRPRRVPSGSLTVDLTSPDQTDPDARREDQR